MRTQAQIIRLARNAGVPYGAHAFLVIACFPDGFEDAWRAVQVTADAEQTKADAQQLADDFGRRHTEKKFEVVEVGAPDTRSMDERLRELIASGLDFGTILTAFGEHQQKNMPELMPYAEAVDDVLPSDEGSYSTDMIPIVSKGDDEGAYVLAWVWVSDVDAGLKLEYDWHTGEDHIGIHRVDSDGDAEDDFVATTNMEAEEQVEAICAKLNDGELTEEEATAQVLALNEEG